MPESAFYTDAENKRVLCF